MAAARRASVESQHHRWKAVLSRASGFKRRASVESQHVIVIVGCPPHRRRSSSGYASVESQHRVIVGCPPYRWRSSSGYASDTHRIRIGYASDESQHAIVIAGCPPIGGSYSSGHASAESQHHCWMHAPSADSSGYALVESRPMVGCPPHRWRLCIGHQSSPSKPSLDARRISGWRHIVAHGLTDFRPPIKSISVQNPSLTRSHCTALVGTQTQTRSLFKILPSSPYF
ncbi:hypothetical protein DFH06DRAFT_1310885, partial [Mycena polygramma]